jgi:hypothetical protein
VVGYIPVLLISLRISCLDHGSRGGDLQLYPCLHGTPLPYFTRN